jgi:hypothetical protein
LDVNASSFLRCARASTGQAQLSGCPFSTITQNSRGPAAPSLI